MELSHQMLLLGEFAASLWLHTERDPPQEEWHRAIAENATFLKRHRVHPLQLRTVVITDGAAPNAAQRAQFITEVFQHHKCKTSVVTTVLSNPVKRGIATALTWLNPNAGFFLPEEMPKALAHVDLGFWTGQILSEYEKLAAQLPPNKTLWLIGEAMSAPSGLHRQAEDAGAALPGKDRGGVA
jgi:hypothetical protein